MVPQRHSRAERDREVVQRTAELLTSDLSLEELFRGVCELLARFVDASMMFIALKDSEGAHVEFLLDNGVIGRLENARVDPQSRTAEVLRTGEPILKRRLEDWTEGRLTVSLPGDSEHHQPQSAIFVPLKYGTEIIGALSVQTAVPDAYNMDDVLLLQTCALYLSVSVQRSKLETQSAALRSMASTDGLTGLANRGSFDKRIREEWERAIRAGAELPLVLADIDFFKSFNDTYGHVAGDAALQQVANAILSCAGRPADFLARYGGEEFVAIIPTTDANGALHVAESMRRAVADLRIVHSGSNLGFVTISVGVACAKPTAGSTPESLIRAADASLYQAKRGGRNRVAGDNYVSDVPQAQARRIHRHNLGTPGRELLGRSADVRQIRALMRHASVLTIAGVAGCGKSAVAIEAGRQDLPHFRDGVWYVDFSSAHESTLLRTKIASVLQMPDATAQSLRDRYLLLILDNCDRVRASCADFVRSLSNAGNVHVLVTSCEPLGVPGEVSLRLAPLDPKSAAELFVERARAAGQSQSVAACEAAPLASKHLGMLPLTLTFAGTQLRGQSFEEITARLPARAPQTAVEIGAWCWRLLSVEERSLLSALSVFSDGASADALAAVYQADAAECDPAAILAILIAKSLVRAQPEGRGARYTLQPSIAQFISSNVDLQEDRLRYAIHHAHYYRKLARILANGHSTNEWQPLLESARPELENFRAVLRFALEDLHDPQTGARLAIDLIRYWEELGLAAEGCSWLEVILAIRGANFAAEVKAGLLYGIAHLERYRSHSDRTLDFASEAVALSRTLDDRRLLGAAVLELAAAETARRNLAAARAGFEEGLDLYRAAENARGVAEALNGLAAIAVWENDVPKARALFEESLALFRDLQNDRGIATALANMSRIHAMTGDIEGAIRLTRQSLAIFERLHDPSQAAFELSNLGEWELANGNLQGAHTALRASLERFYQYGDEWLCANVFDCLGRLAQAEGDWNRALRLHGFADALFERTGTPRQPHDQSSYDTMMHAAYLEFGETDAQRLLQNARACPRDEVFAEVLGA